jgi:outer membrane protein, adhesin transport system
MKLLSLVPTSRVCVAVFCLLPLVVSGQTLPEAVQIALSQYPTILAAQSRVEVAKYQVMQAKSEHWPQVAWQGTNSSYSGVTPTAFAPNDTWIQSPAVSVNIWSGWRIQSQVDRASAIRESQRHEETITRDEVAFLVVEAYLNWMRLGTLVEIAQRNVVRHERLTSDVSKIAKVDQGRRIDVTQAIVRTENARLTLEQFRAEHEVAAQRLRRMLSGSLPEHPSGYKQILGTLPKDKNQALALLNDRHPVIAQQIARAQAAEAGILNAKSGFSPTVDLSYQKQTTQGTGQGDYVTQLNVRVPIFDGGSAFSRTRGAYAELEVAKQELAEARITLRENLLSAWSNLATAKQRATLGSRQVKSAKELVSGYDQQFRVGRRSLLDLLTVEDNLFSYQVSVTNASFEERNAKARILAILNQLASSYELAGVPAGSSPVTKTGDVAAPKRPIFSNAN